MIEALRCACCDLPFAKVQQGAVLIRSSHRGENHLNIVPLAQLIALATASEKSQAGSTKGAGAQPSRA